MIQPSIVKRESDLDADIKSHYINLLESSSAYYHAKKTARKAWIDGDTKGMENARIKFSNYLLQLNYQIKHFQFGDHMTMSGLHQSCIGSLTKEIEKASRNLNALQQRRLDRLCNDFDISYTRPRIPRDEDLLLDDKDGLFTTITEIYPNLELQVNGLPSQCCTTFERERIFDESDIFHSLQSISQTILTSIQSLSINKNQEFRQDLWSALAIPIKTVSIHELKEIFKDLHPNIPQVGIDTDLNSKIKNIIETKSIPEARLIAKRGIPCGSRAQIWDLILQSDFVDDFEVYRNTYCRKLTEIIASTEFVYDRLLLVDVKHAQNDESYFVFEEILNKVILFWSRDTWYIDKINLLKKTKSENNTKFPPNGIYPIWGLVLYAMPICYIYDNPCSIYFTFRELYARYFIHLHTLSDRTDNILYLCIAFENLFKESESHLFFHLQYNLDVQPLSIAFRWILYGFVGILSPDQVLLLWDKMIGYNSCLIFSVMAAGIFKFRKEEILASKNEKEVLNCLNDLSNLETIPILLSFIFD